MNTGRYSCSHHHKFTSRTHMHSNIAIADSWWMPSQLLPLTAGWKSIKHTKQWRYVRRTSRLKSRLNRVPRIFRTWVKTRDSFKWYSVRVQIKSQVKCQVKSDNEYGPRNPTTITAYMMSDMLLCTPYIPRWFWQAICQIPTTAHVDVHCWQLSQG